MKARHTVILFSLLLSALAGLSSCVYPFEAELKGESGTFVIEGDILIGEVMTVNLSYTAPVSNPEEVTVPDRAKVWVEDNTGANYVGELFEKGEYRIDMTEADPSLQYRLRVTNEDTDRDYSSSWLRVCAKPEIDSLSYIINEEKSVLNIALSMHSEGESYFKWSYKEDWEYHSQFYAQVLYEPPVRNTSSWNNGLGRILDIPPADPIYYCWNKDVSSEIMVFSTETQKEDRFVDLEFHSIPNDDIRIQQLYHIEVKLEPLTKDAYLYWDNIKSNSEYNGSLFAPNPSEMVGNIRCMNDTTDMVFGFINAAQCDTDIMFYNNSVERFYKAGFTYSQDPTVVSSSKQWFEQYSIGLLPYDYQDPAFPNTTLWVPKYFVDCRCMGGTKDRPEYWPNQHK